MSHVRQQIREAVVAKLKEITDIGDRAYPYRTIPHTTLPDIVVYTTEDEVDHEHDAGDKEIHILTVQVEARAKVTDDLDDVLDGLCVDVEKKMMEDASLGGLVKYLELVKTTIEMQGESEKPVGVATLEYAAWYRVSRTDPETVVA